METEMTHCDCGPVPPSKNDLLDAIQAACSIEISDVDFYNEGNESMENTFMQSIDEMAVEEESPEGHSSQDHIKQVGINAGGDTVTSGHWTCKSLLQLVKTVERYPELWDNQYIYSIYSRNARWETVADILNTTMEEFKLNPVTAKEATSKWRRLRGQKTIIEKNKSRHRRKRRPRIPNEFSYYNHMDFIFNPPSKQALKDGVTFPTEKLTQHDSKVKWNYQSTMALISEVEKHPVIWASNKGHPPSSAKTTAYCVALDYLNSSVAAFIKNPITMNDLRWKWKNLRGYRNRCRRNLKPGHSNGTEWEFFHAMDFLHPNHSQEQEDSTTDSSLTRVRINQEENKASVKCKRQGYPFKITNFLLKLSCMVSVLSFGLDIRSSGMQP